MGFSLVEPVDRTEDEDDELAQVIADIRRRRDDAASMQEFAEWCVAYEEAIGGRPPTMGAAVARPEGC